MGTVTTIPAGRSPHGIFLNPSAPGTAKLARD
jgi:hypothetical protein